MANPSRAKGTKWEVELVPILRDLFGDHVHRSPLTGTQDYGDFVNTPWLIEAKNTHAPRFLEWCATAARKTGGLAWAVIWKGDRRKGLGPYVTVPLEHYVELCRAWVAFWEENPSVDPDDEIGGLV